MSRYLIALLSYGAVPKEYFIDIVINALRDARSVFSDMRAALKGSLSDKACSLWVAIIFLLSLLRLLL